MLNMPSFKISKLIISISIAGLFSVLSLPALAQDALQCSPSDVKLNRNLRFVNTDDDKNDIYLGTGKIYLGSNSSAPYITKNNTDMLLQSTGNILVNSDSILLQNASGSRMGGFYNTDPDITLRAANNFHSLIVDGTIEARKVVGLDQLCIGTTGCRSSWPVDTDDQGLSWDDTTSTLSITNSGPNSVILTGAGGGGGGEITEIKAADTSITVLNGTGPVVTIGVTGSAATPGVSKIIAGSGISISSNPSTGNPTEGTGEVTISTSGSAPCAVGFTRAGNECLISFGTESLIQRITKCNSGDPSLNNWATLDIPSLNGTNAVFAIVRSYCSETKTYIRETGSSLSTTDETNELCWADNNGTDWERYTTGRRYIKLDNNKDFDWYNIGTDCKNNTMDARIYLAGYIEN